MSGSYLSHQSYRKIEARLEFVDSRKLFIERIAENI